MNTPPAIILLQNGKEEGHFDVDEPLLIILLIATTDTFGIC